MQGAVNHIVLPSTLPYSPSHTPTQVMQGAANHILPVSMRTAVSRKPRESLPKQDRSGRNASIVNFREMWTVLRQMPRYFDMLVQGLDAAYACPG
jgi:hypothetical protein